MRSRPRSGNSTNVSILSVKRPLAEKRLRWMSSTGGRRESESFLVAFRSVLQCGQCLLSGEYKHLGKEDGQDVITHQASDFSMTSSLTNASIHCCKETLDTVRPAGIGRVRYMNVLYVVDVYKKALVSYILEDGGRECADGPYDT